MEEKGSPFFILLIPDPYDQPLLFVCLARCLSAARSITKGQGFVRNHCTRPVSRWTLAVARTMCRPGAAYYRSSDVISGAFRFLFFLFFFFSSFHSLSFALIYAKLAREPVLQRKRRKNKIKENKPQASSGAGLNCPGQEIAAIKHAATFCTVSVSRHAGPPKCASTPIS